MAASAGLYSKSTSALVGCFVMKNFERILNQVRCAKKSVKNVAKCTPYEIILLDHQQGGDMTEQEAAFVCRVLMMKI